MEFIVARTHHIRSSIPCDEKLVAVLDKFDRMRGRRVLDTLTDTEAAALISAYGRAHTLLMKRHDFDRARMTGAEYMWLMDCLQTELVASLKSPPDSLPSPHPVPPVHCYVKHNKRRKQAEETVSCIASRPCRPRVNVVREVGDERLSLPVAKRPYHRDGDHTQHDKRLAVPTALVGER